MAIKTKMDAMFAVNVTSQSVHEFQRIAHGIKEAIAGGVAKMNVLAANPQNNFASVDSEITTEGAALLTLFAGFETQLAAHAEFLDWVEP